MFGTTALVLGMLAAPVVIGLVIGLATMGWWKELLFEGVYGAPAIIVIVLPIAVLVPFLCALATQFGIWAFVKR